MSVFFTSDQHIGHILVAILRWNATYPEAPLARDNLTDEDRRTVVAWHDEMLAKNWDAVVTPTDQVWVLGDISVGGRAREKAALEWVDARPGEKHLVAGNHDSCHPCHRESHKDQKRYLEVFDSVQSAARRRFSFDSKKVDVVLSHFPYYADRGDGPPREMQWRLRDEGAYLLHGHVHSNVKFAGREIHVGLDAWDFAPVPLEAIAAYIKERMDKIASGTILATKKPGLWCPVHRDWHPSPVCDPNEEKVSV